MTGRCAILAAATLALASDAAAQSDGVLLTDVNVVDVATGTVTEDQSILIEDGLIATVGADLDTGTAERVDAGGAYAIPGLWDSHVHVFSTPTEPETALPLYLLHGVTGIPRDGPMAGDTGDKAATVAPSGRAVLASWTRGRRASRLPKGETS